MILIYHSQGLLPARQAAAIHLGSKLEEVPTGEGLILLRPDDEGRLVAALTGASQAQVVERAFQSIAEALGIPSSTWTLQAVGPPTTWPERWASLLTYLGLRRLAQRWIIGPSAEGARQAVAETRKRLSAQGGRPQ